jgi:hypothetical protein
MNKFAHSCLALFFAMLISPVMADQRVIDCSRGDLLADAINRARADDTIVIVGRCRGGVTMNKSGVTLDGQNKTIVDGEGKDAITINGASRVTLRGIEVRGGASGVVAKNGAHVALNQIASNDNARFGILLSFNASADVTKCSVQRNGVNGLDLEGNSSAQLTGTFSGQDHSRGFAIFINRNSSMTVFGSVTAQRNIIGMQVGNGSSAFLVGPAANLTLKENFADSLTVVSNLHLFEFGGAIDAHHNGLNGDYCLNP